MKKGKSVLFTVLFLLVSAQTVLAAEPITKRAAEEIAAGYVAEQSELLKSELEKDTFVCRFFNKNKQEWYKITLDKKEGKLISFDSCKTVNKGSAVVVLTPEAVQNIVLEEIAETDIVSCNLVEDSGIYKYELSFSNDLCYGEYTIHPESGAVLEREIYVGASSVSTTDAQLVETVKETTASAVYIGVEKAQKAALNKVPGADVLSCELADEDGRAIYRGALKKGYFKYEFAVDAITGTMIKWEIVTEN